MHAASAPTQSDRYLFRESQRQRACPGANNKRRTVVRHSVTSVTSSARLLLCRFVGDDHAIEKPVKWKFIEGRRMRDKFLDSVIVPDEAAEQQPG